jgi:hypothetical protein
MAPGRALAPTSEMHFIYAGRIGMLQPARQDNLAMIPWEGV